MPSQNTSLVKKWFWAIRPSSLLLSSASVGLGVGMAFGDGIGRIFPTIAALFGAWLLHILVNLVNDYGDAQKGVDQKGEYDPMRNILVGEISLAELRNGIDVVLALLIIPCFYLIARAGWPIFGIALLGILAAIFYTAGKRPLGYLGFGDFMVFIFFGLAAVCGSYYVQMLEMNAAVFLASLSPGLFAVGVLTINNIRDYEKDKGASKKTLVVRFGKTFGKIEYVLAVFIACLMPVLIYNLIHDHRKILFSSLMIFLFIPVIKIVVTTQERRAFDKAIGLTVMLSALYSLSFVLGWIF